VTPSSHQRGLASDIRKQQQPGQRGGEQDQAGRVELVPCARDPDSLAVGGKPGQDGRDADDRERHVDQERQPPAADGDEQAAERRADGHGGLPGDGQRAQHAAGGFPVQPPGLMPDHGHRGRVGSRRAEPDDDARRDQAAQGPAQAPEQAADGDADRAEEVNTPRADQVGQPPHRRLADRCRQVERGDQPGGGGRADAERVPDRH
jgi:hypothetical protein